MLQHRTPTFLSERHYPIYKVRCPIHGFIHFSLAEREIIDTPIFHRLRYIKQLALTELIYPGASHSRWEHSIGVMEVATRCFDALLKNSGATLAARFREVEQFSSDSEDVVLAKSRQLVRLAALLHDVGHTCFSHAAEGVIFDGQCHEDLTVSILRQPELLGRRIDECFWAGCSQTLAELIEKKGGLPPQLTVIQDIVSGQLDADRTDYLLRDSHHCGVDYGKFDYQRMIESLDIYENSELGGPQVALGRQGIHTFEALILARYQMNTQVYYHRLRTIYDYYLEKYFEAVSIDGRMPSDIKGLLLLNDVRAMNMIFDDSEKSTVASRFAQRIAKRRHHKLILETSADTNARGLRCAKKIAETLTQENSGVDFVYRPVSANIHKLLRPEDMSDEGLVDFVLTDGKGSLYRHLAEASQVLRPIGSKFQCARIYADVDCPKKLEMLRNFANEQWKAESH